MKQTAVEWLFDQLVNRTDKSFFLEELNKAKEMEKEQIKAFVVGTYVDLKMKNNKLPYGIEYLNKLAIIEEKAEQYYNETFKSE
jgi:hypothetical protein